MPLSALGSRTVPPDRADYIYGQLREAIVAGALAPGERLLETEIAQTFQVSRTPVREALTKLLGDGLVSDIPGRGLVVTEFPAERVREMFAVRAALEALSASLAAARITPAQLDALEDILRRMEAEAAGPDLVAWGDLNIQFHGVIHAAAGNSFLTDLLDNIYAALKVYQRSRVALHLDRARVGREHRAIVAALRARDADAAAHLTRDHVANALSAWLES